MHPASAESTGMETDSVMAFPVHDETTSPVEPGFAAPAPSGRGPWHSLSLLAIVPLVAGFGVPSVQLYLGEGIRLLPLIMVACLALAVYALNRLTDKDEDDWNLSEDADTRSRNAIVILAATGILMLLVGSLLALQGRLGYAYSFILFSGIAYSCRILPWYSRGRGFTLQRLKAVPFVKNLSIGLTWCAAIFLVPLYDGFIPLESVPRPFFLLAFGHILYIGMNTLFCDMRDLDGDRAAGVTTLATLLGIQGCYRWMAGVASVWGVFLCLLYLGVSWLDSAHLAFLLLAALGYPFTVYLIREKMSASEMTVDFAVESGSIAFAIGVMALAFL